MSVELVILKTYFSRDPRVVHANARKKKKITELLIKNALLNCIRKHFKQKSVSFENDFLTGDITPKKREVFVKNYNDQCWAVKEMMHYLKYDTEVSNNDTIINVNKLLKNKKIENKRYKKSNDSELKSSYIDEVETLQKAANIVIDKVYPKQHSFEEIRYLVNNEVDKLKPVIQADTIHLPDEITKNQDLLNKYMKYTAEMIRTYKKESVELKYSVVLFVLVKNKIKTADAKKLIPMDFKKYSDSFKVIKPKLADLIKTKKI